MTLYHVTLLRASTRYHETVRAGDADEAREIVALRRGEEPGDRWEMEPCR